jgi:D-arabinose 1-dehydrogenase
MKSTAAVLEAFNEPLKITNVEIREPKGEEVLIKIEGAGICRTDLRIWKGLEARPTFKLPIILGHENAGKVVALGDNVKGIKEGDRVVVYATWGDLTCRYCRQGKYSLCKNQVIPGQTTNGGFSEYLLVQSYRWLVKLNSLNPAEAAPLADAGTTSMGAVRKALPFLAQVTEPVIIVNGIGGLASYLIQILKVIASNAKIIAISRSEAHRELALKLGADVAVSMEEANKIVDKLSEGLGAQVVIDLVGNEESVYNLSKLLAQEGGLVLVGLEGKKISADIFDTVVWDKVIIGSNYGTLNDLADVVKLSEEGKLKAVIVKRKLEEINDAFKDLDYGRINGRQVIIP